MVVSGREDMTGENAMVMGASGSMLELCLRDGWRVSCS